MMAASPEQFVPRIEGDEIWGRGSCDTKVNAASISRRKWGIWTVRSPSNWTTDASSR